MLFSYPGDADQYVSVVLTLKHLGQQEWWELTQKNNSNERANSLFPDGKLMFVTVSSDMPSPIATSIVSAGIIGLCIFESTSKLSHHIDKKRCRSGTLNWSLFADLRF